MRFFQQIISKSIENEMSRSKIEQKYKRKVVVKGGDVGTQYIVSLLLKDYVENIEQIKGRTKRAPAMSYYDELITTDKREKEVENFNGKVIGTFCNFVPEELIYASGALPLRLCAGAYHTIKLGEQILPRDVCPLIKSTIGFKLLGLPFFEPCDVVIVPTPCDGKKKLGELLSSYLPVWGLEIPHSKEYLKRENWFAEIEVLKKKLEVLTQNEITKEKLAAAILLLSERQKVFARLYEIRKYIPSVITESDALLVTWTSFYDDVRRWIQNTKKLCDELEEMHTNVASPVPVRNGANNSEEIRLLLTGAPIIWPNLKLVHIIEETGANIVIDDICSGSQRLYDPVVVDEWTFDGMIRAVAQKYLLPSTCPCFTNSDDRIDRLLERIKEFSIEGVVYHNLRLCQLFDIEEGIIQQVLKDKNVPMLTLYTDYSKEDIGQIKTRVQTFIEMLKPF